MAYDVDVSARRLGNYVHVLRELVHLSCGHLALEPRFDVKALLGDHLHDDARAVSKLHRRLHELNADPGAPSEELSALLDRANTADTSEYIEIAYGTLKPTLIAALRIHLANLDPLVDEPGLRLATQLLHRQERHVAELPAAHEQIAFEDLGALEVHTHEQRTLKVMDRLDRPARDAFVEVTDTPPEDDGRQRSVHGLMDSALCAAELTARNSHEHPDMPWDFHVDMARQTWDEIRHAEIFDRLMATELGCHWGDYPVAFGDFRSVYALDLAGRLGVFAGISEQMAQQRTALAEVGKDELARVLDQLLADERDHVRSAARWRS
jgi:uncharacterized ferritin-like protein (DUF455 family)